ncbi:MAG TPA: serine/threonine-protein kinase [Blastocatellia bacterium]|nr:serine/threonine-protein kinase [Blastocatellia bacterium]
MPGQEFQTGELLDNKYQIERLLGQGGMGAVYQAIHLGTKRMVAVKVIHPQYSNDEEFVARFRREAEATGRLRHPNVVDVTDFGFAQSDIGRVAYLVMEYLDGCTLEEILAEEKSLRIDWVVDILEQVCSAVDAAHKLGIVHRDLKPDNIWLEPNRRGGYTVKVLDFGLVKLGGGKTDEAVSADQPAPLVLSGAVAEAATLIQPSSRPVAVDNEAATLIKPADTESSNGNTAPPISADASEMETAVIQRQVTNSNDKSSNNNVTGGAVAALTQVGSVMGTPLYMSPEQCRGDVVDSRSDIYSLGVIAYRMLAGETPFTGKVIDLIKQHTSVDPVPIRQKNKKVPKRMARVIMSALAKKPADRPQTANGFASALKAGSEKTSTLLRQAISLYAERFPIFIKISLIVYVPLILLVLLNKFDKQIIPWEWLGQHGSALPVLVAIFLILSTMLSQLGAAVVINAMTVPIVLQSIVAPLRPISIRPVAAALLRRWRVFILTSAIVVICSIIGFLLLFIPGILVHMSFALYAPVIMMEGLNVRNTLKRAYRLMKRSWTTVLIITFIQMSLPMLVNRASIDLKYHASSNSFDFNLVQHGNLSQLLIILITPLTATMISLLYLKTRQAGGEGIRESIEQFTAHEMPSTKWQSKMISRLKI